MYERNFCFPKWSFIILGWILSSVLCAEGISANDPQPHDSPLPLHLTVAENSLKDQEAFCGGLQQAENRATEKIHLMSEVLLVPRIQTNAVWVLEILCNTVCLLNKWCVTLYTWRAQFSTFQQYTAFIYAHMQIHISSMLHWYLNMLWTWGNVTNNNFHIHSILTS